MPLYLELMVQVVDYRHIPAKYSAGWLIKAREIMLVFLKEKPRFGTENIWKYWKIFRLVL